MFEGKVVFVCIDTDEDTHFMIADAVDVDQYWEDMPNSDRFACANAVGREPTAAELDYLAAIEGCIAY